MPLIHDSYGKGRVRVLRVYRDGDHNEVRDVSVRTMLEGDFAAAYTAADNRLVVATDTIKNITNIVAREAVRASAEDFAQAIARRFLDRYSQVRTVRVDARETRWSRASSGGAPHPHAFVLDGNGTSTTDVVATRDGVTVASGVAGFTFMKSTGSGWADFVSDDYTTLRPTADRIAATAMDATWTWTRPPEDYPAANARVLDTMLALFATTYSRGLQDSLFRMAEAALAAVPELGTVRIACPNKHYLPVDLAPFGLASDDMVFTATDEPHGQIECLVGR